MSTNREKILDMLSTIREIRKKLAKSGTILDIIASHGPIARFELLKQLPGVSPRTVDRKLVSLLDHGQIQQEKKGREVVYLIHNKAS